ncbi:MAG: DegT/DnrJ/EryC1/StrS family aminotransferase [Mesonia hippocampi]|uniref:DegT/DnrJ/EryC1/StrS family aminotransferase n=1 Tax=Mesonia hippocampi TaxID=1628250 RepID=UPI003F9A2AB9
MEKPKIWLSSPHMGGEEQNFVNAAFQENWVAPLGPNVNGFEEDIENYLQADKKVAALSSGTAALHLALIQLGVQPGDEVLCQSMTFAASANPITYLGANPVFIDSEPTTWNICPKALEKAILDRKAKGKTIKAIVIVHLYGMPCLWNEVKQIADKHQIPIIEDAAEALGSTYKGKKCGTLGQFGVLSFNGNKIITTSGGGALVCATTQAKQKTVFYATQARDNAPHYQHTHIGYNYRLSNISAGIGRGQMQVLDKHIDLRRQMNAFYQALFAPIAGVEVFSEPTADFFSNHWLSAILVDTNKTGGISREDIRLALQEENIESRPLWKPMHLQPIFKEAPYYGEKVAENLFDSGLCLPSGSNLTDQDRERIKTTIQKLFKQ